MKVMCIKVGKFSPSAGNDPSFGEICEVKQCNFYSCCYIVYNYEVDNDGLKQSFCKTNFAPLSDIDEVELINEKELINA